MNSKISRVDELTRLHGRLQSVHTVPVTFWDGKQYQLVGWANKGRFADGSIITLPIENQGAVE